MSLTRLLGPRASEVQQTTRCRQGGVPRGRGGGRGPQPTTQKLKLSQSLPSAAPVETTTLFDRLGGDAPLKAVTSLLFDK